MAGSFLAHEHPEVRAKKLRELRARLDAFVQSLALLEIISADTDEFGLKITGGAAGGGPTITPRALLAGLHAPLLLRALGNKLVELGNANGTHLKAGSTTATIVNHLLAQGSATGASLVLTGEGADTDITIAFAPKGAGDGQLRSGGGTVNVRWNNSGLGFYGATPVAKPAVSGSRGGNAALASLLTQLATLGLVTDSTTA